MARPPAETLSYKDASEELEGILRALEADRLDVDQLAAASERAVQLVERCRAVLTETRDRLERVLPKDAAS